MARNLNDQAKEILSIAERRGTETNFFFATTFNRYLVQINMLTDLEKKIKENGTLVTKEYVKGRGNLYTNPAISEYNKTATAANQTVAILIKVIKAFQTEDGDDTDDELLNALGIKQ